MFGHFVIAADIDDSSQAGGRKHLYCVLQWLGCCSCSRYICCRNTDITLEFQTIL